MAEISEQLPPDFDHEPVDRSVVSLLSRAILPLRSCGSEIEFDLALAVLRDLGEVRSATSVHRFVQDPTIEKIMHRGLFTDSFLFELRRREGVHGCRGRSGRSRESNARQAPLPTDTRRSLLGSRKGVSRVTPSEPFACPVIFLLSSLDCSTKSGYSFAHSGYAC